VQWRSGSAMGKFLWQGENFSARQRALMIFKMVTNLRKTTKQFRKGKEYDVGEV